MRELKQDLGLIQRIYCDKAGKKQLCQKVKNKEPLPPDVRQDEGGFYRADESEATDAQIRLLLMYRQMLYLRIIPYCLVFFVALVIIGIVLILK